MAELDHIVPHAQVIEVENELAKLAMLSASLDRAKSDETGKRLQAKPRKLCETGMISEETLENFQAKFIPVGRDADDLCPCKFALYKKIFTPKWNNILS